jgi:hypothetical protein
MTVENLWCNQELQKGNQYQPVVALGASLSRASNLAKTSLARLSSLALSKGSRTLELSRMSRSLERMSRPLGRVSHMDHAAQMAVGRVRGAIDPTAMYPLSKNCKGVLSTFHLLIRSLTLVQASFVKLCWALPCELSAWAVLQGITTLCMHAWPS